MSKKYRSRYGWKKEKWLAYKAWAERFFDFMLNPNIRKIIAEMEERED